MLATKTACEDIGTGLDSDCVSVGRYRDFVGVGLCHHLQRFFMLNSTFKLRYHLQRFFSLVKFAVKF